MYQGRSFQNIGNFKEALSYYEELLQHPDEPANSHELKTKVLLLAIDCWLADSQKKYAEVCQGRYLDRQSVSFRNSHQRNSWLSVWRLRSRQVQ